MIRVFFLDDSGIFSGCFGDHLYPKGSKWKEGKQILPEGLRVSGFNLCEPIGEGRNRVFDTGSGVGARARGVM